jgi:hypothetical protein
MAMAMSHQHRAMMMSTDTVDMSSVGATHGGGGSCTVAPWDLSCSVTSLRTGDAAGVGPRGASPPDRMEANSRLQPASCSGASLPFVVRPPGQTSRRARPEICGAVAVRVARAPGAFALDSDLLSLPVGDV